MIIALPRMGFRKPCIDHPMCTILRAPICNLRHKFCFVSNLSVVMLSCIVRSEGLGLLDTSRPRLNIRTSYFYDGNSYTGKTTPLHWDDPPGAPCLVNLLILIYIGLFVNILIGLLNHKKWDTAKYHRQSTKQLLPTILEKTTTMLSKMCVYSYHGTLNWQPL